MNNDHQKLPPQLKIRLTNGEVLFFENAQVDILPNAILLHDRNRPNTTRLFTFANTIDMEIPGNILMSKIQKPGII